MEENLKFEKNMLSCKEIAGLYCMTTKSTIASNVHNPKQITKYLFLSVKGEDYLLPMMVSAKTRIYLRRIVKGSRSHLDLGPDLDTSKDVISISLQGVRIK